MQNVQVLFPFCPVLISSYVISFGKTDIGSFDIKLTLVTHEIKQKSKKICGRKEIGVLKEKL